MRLNSTDEDTKIIRSLNILNLLELLDVTLFQISRILPGVTLHMDLNADGYFCPATTAVSASHQPAVLTQAAPRIAVRPLAAHTGFCSATPARRAEVLVLYGRRRLLREQLPPDKRRAKEATNGVDNL